MQRISRELFDRITLDASLQRLGVVELEERLEFSPLLAVGGTQADPGDETIVSCRCKYPDPVDFPIPHVLGPLGDGMGSTGPTDGGLIR
jgi:hypothetical protein